MKRPQVVVLTMLTVCAVLTAPFVHAEKGRIKSGLSKRKVIPDQPSNYYFSSVQTLRTREGPYRIEHISSGHQVPVRRDGTRDVKNPADKRPVLIKKDGSVVVEVKTDSSGRVVHEKYADGKSATCWYKVDQEEYVRSQKIVVTLPDGRSIEATDAQSSDLWSTYALWSPTVIVVRVAQLNTPAKLTEIELKHLSGVMANVQKAINRDNEQRAKTAAKRASAIVNEITGEFIRE